MAQPRRHHRERNPLRQQHSGMRVPEQVQGDSNLPSLTPPGAKSHNKTESAGITNTDKATIWHGSKSRKTDAAALVKALAASRWRSPAPTARSCLAPEVARPHARLPEAPATVIENSSLK